MGQVDDAISITVAILIVVTVGFVQEYRGVQQDFTHTHTHTKSFILYCAMLCVRYITPKNLCILQIVSMQINLC